MNRLVYYLLLTLLAARYGRTGTVSAQSKDNFLRTADNALTAVHLEALEGLVNLADNEAAQTRSEGEEPACFTGSCSTRRITS